jgi:hypothetical protein
VRRPSVPTMFATGFVLLAIGCLYLWSRPDLWLPIVSAEDRLRIARRRRVLYETDHVQLMAACTKVITNRNLYKTTPRIAESTNVSWLDPRDNELPSILRSIDPSCIVVDDGRLRADLWICGSSCAHFGIVAYLNKDAYSQTNFLIESEHYEAGHFGLKELVDGLYYYDEWGLDGKERWQKKLLDSIKPGRLYGVP